MHRLTNSEITHIGVMQCILQDLNRTTRAYVLKGGTALLLMYTLDRFSEDIDLDGFESGQHILKYLINICKTRGYKYNIKKDTQYVKRLMVDYGGDRLLKIETSFRDLLQHELLKSENILGDTITVYSIDKLLSLKIIAYGARDAIRDLYDIIFITENYWDKLSTSTKAALSNQLYYKGIEHYDYLVATQRDELINYEDLDIRYLNLWNRFFPEEQPTDFFK